MPTPILATAKKNDLDNILSEFLPKLTKKQQAALQKIAECCTIPTSIRSWCKLLDISFHTWYAWITNSNWRNAFIEINRAVECTNLPSVMAHVRKRSGKSDFAARTHLEYIGALQPTTPGSNTSNVVNIAVLAAHKDDLKTIADQFCRGLLQPKAPDPEVIEGQIDVE